MSADRAPESKPAIFTTRGKRFYTLGDALGHNNQVLAWQLDVRCVGRRVLHSLRRCAARGGPVRQVAVRFQLPRMSRSPFACVTRSTGRSWLHFAARRAIPPPRPLPPAPLAPPPPPSTFISAFISAFSPPAPPVPARPLAPPPPPLPPSHSICIYAISRPPSSNARAHRRRADPAPTNRPDRRCTHAFSRACIHTHAHGHTCTHLHNGHRLHGARSYKLFTRARMRTRAHARTRSPDLSPPLLLLSSYSLPPLIYRREREVIA